VATLPSTRREDGTLSVLLVVNPTLDLDGAEREGARVQQLLSRTPGTRIELRHGADARKDRLAADLRSGLYDVVHYAGHAFFDPEDPAQSGILCANRQILTGADLAGFGNLPSLVFFNACEAGRVRGRGVEKKSKHRDRRLGLERNVGLAEAFLRGGVANYLGTYWPVGDGVAETFADALYTRILDHAPLGAAVLAARSAVREKHPSSADWSNYMLYGSHDFVLKA
jgi:CHAT domain-containing protein